MDELAQFMGSYAEAWNRADLDSIVGAYATPCFVVKGGQVLRHWDEAAKHSYFGDLLAGNQGEGRIPGHRRARCPPVGARRRHGHGPLGLPSA